MAGNQLSEGYFKEICRGIALKLGASEITYLGKLNKCKPHCVHVLSWDEISSHLVSAIVGYSFVWHCSAVCAAEEVLLQREKVFDGWYWYRLWTWKWTGNSKCSVKPFNSQKWWTSNFSL